MSDSEGSTNSSLVMVHASQENGKESQAENQDENKGERPNVFTCESFLKEDVPANCIPYILNCTHIVSENDLDSLTDGRTTAVSCPRCAHETSPPFYPSPTMQNFSEDLAKLKEGKLVTCAECSNEPALLFCADCNVGLCNACDKTLHHHKVLKAHTRTNKNSAAANFYPRCPLHKQELLKIFCIDCETPICRDCKDFEDAHKSHKTTLLGKVVEEKKKELKCKLEELVEPTCKVEQMLMDCENKRHKLKDSVAEVKQNILDRLTRYEEENLKILENARQHALLLVSASSTFRVKVDELTEDSTPPTILLQHQKQLRSDIDEKLKTVDEAILQESAPEDQTSPHLIVENSNVKLVLEPFFCNKEVELTKEVNVLITRYNSSYTADYVKRQIAWPSKYEPKLGDFIQFIQKSSVYKFHIHYGNAQIPTQVNLHHFWIKNK